MLTQKCTDQTEWDTLVQSERGHPLQMWGWGDVKTKNGWQATRLLIKDEVGEIVGGAQVLEKPIPLIQKTLAYIPRGPWCADTDRQTVLARIQAYMLQNSRAISILMEPDWENADGLEGWKPTTQHILIGDTLRFDLTRSEEDLLADMSKKTRQYIRKSSNDGVQTRAGKASDLDKVLSIYRQTAHRAGFGIHTDEYYRTIYESLSEASRMYVAEADGEVVAFVWLAATPEVAFELYGGMNDKGQNLRANYCLKWYAMTQLKRDGVRVYDVNGLLNDGISTFKRSFAQHENTLVGSYVYPLSAWHTLWTIAEPLAKRVARVIAKIR